MPIAELERCRLNYRIDGNAEKSWLVLTDSLGSDLHLWDRVIPYLEGSHRILRFDFRGHGGSPATGGGLTIEDLAGDIIALMDRLGIEQAHLAGISLGAMASLTAALDHRDRVLSLTFCNAIGESSDGYRAFWRGRTDIVQREGMEAIADATLERWLTAGARQPIRNDARAMLLATSVEGFSAAAEALGKLDLTRRLGSLAVNARFIAGADDLAAPPEVMRTLAKAGNDSPFTLIEGAAHLSSLEQPGPLAEAILQTTGG